MKINNNNFVSNSFLVVGLGNPGIKYLKTRHNVGSQLLDFIGEELQISMTQNKFQAQFGKGNYQGHTLLFLKPQTYMNNSGISIRSCQKFFKIETEQVIVLHDDLDLVPNRFKMAVKGGHGGHNGIRSTIQHLQTQQFLRLKIGIGHPRTMEQGQEVSDYVLQNFSNSEQNILAQKFEIASQGLKVLFTKGSASAMNWLNSQTS